MMLVTVIVQDMSSYVVPDMLFCTGLCQLVPLCEVELPVSLCQFRRMNDQSTHAPPGKIDESSKIDGSSAKFNWQALLDWYDRQGRDLPWRRRWPELAPAYHVWLSEIMLQQTVVATVIPYFLEFTRRWPDVHALAKAPLDDVLAAWAGLGYYARARNLHKAAQFVVAEYNGEFSKDYESLLTLPGVGPYTAGAISVIGFDQQGVVVDGNIERVMARHFAITTPLPAAKKEIGAVYAAVMPDARRSDFPQSLMDFANAVCTVKNPGCGGCPLATNCAALALDIAETLPVKAAKKPKETRRGIAFVAHDDAGNAVIIRREGRGMLGGMLAFPSHGWASRGEVFDPQAPLANAPFAAQWQVLPEGITHVFTHFALDMDIAIAVVEPSHVGLVKIRPADLPSLMRKVWSHAIKGQ